MFENFKVPSELIPSDPRFGVGPSLIPHEAVKKLADSKSTYLGTSHRKASVKSLVKEVQDGIRTYYNLPDGYEVILGNGGATFFWDVVALNFVEKNSYHFVCGEFTDKWAKAHKNVPWLSVEEKRVEFGQGIHVEDVQGFDTVCCTLNETSTGVQTPLIPKLSNPDALMMVDATSGAGQIKADFKNIDVYYFSPQKVFAADGGLYVAILSPKAIARAEKIAKDKTRFIPESLKIMHAIEFGRGNQTYNTPAIGTIFLLNEQIKLMNKLGEDEVIRLAKEKAKFMYDWAEEKPYLAPYIKEKEFQSQVVITLDLDEKYNADDLTKVLRDQKVVFDIDGYRKLGRNQFRIALFHNITLENLKKLTQIISLAIEG